MNEKTKHEETKKLITPDQISQIESCADPTMATDQICGHDLKTACALIDSISPLGAAFVLCTLKTRAQYGNPKARAIVSRAEKLEIRGVKGLCHALDEMDLYHQLAGAFRD